MAFYKSGADVMLSGDDYADMKDIIHTDLVGTVKEDLTKRTQSMISGVDAYWTGTAAESYKTYVNTELERVTKLLDEVEENIIANLANIGADMQAIDANLAGKIDQLGNGGN